MKDWLGRKKPKSEGSCGKKKMRGNTGEVLQLIETGIGIMTGRGTGIEKGIVTMKDLVKEMVEVAGKGEGDQIGRTAVQIMEEKAVRIDTENVIEAGHVLPTGMVGGGHQGVLVALNRGLCRNISEF